MNNFVYYLVKLRERSLGKTMKIIAGRLLCVLLHQQEKLAARFFRVNITDKGLLANIDNLISMEEVLGSIRGRRPFFIISYLETKNLHKLIKQQFPVLTAETIAEADRICRHNFDLLGSGSVSLAEFVEKHGGSEVCGYLPWHHDFKTGYKWNPKKYFKEIKIPYGKADIKIPWELSRFQHLTVLGQAYWLTANEKYAEEFIQQVEDWIDHNPVGFGVNWASTMDVAIRVANWILGFYFFKQSPALKGDFLKKFLKNLLMHGRHIERNLENKGITNNHYISNLAGLIYLGIAFPEFKKASHWREFGIRELIKEIDIQVYNDGVSFEASTCYHRLALELFFYPALLCRQNGLALPQSYLDKLEKMFGFMLSLLKPDGRIPQIGDNDSGRLHIFGKRHQLDMTYLFTFAVLYYNTSKYKLDEFSFAPEALWLFGPEAYINWQKYSVQNLEELRNCAYPDGGIYIIRDKRDYMVVSCGSNGSGGLGGHAHNDKLSFELNIDGEDIIVDPGTYLYTSEPKSRDLFRSTSSHSTIEVNQHEQNPIQSGSLFKLPDITNAGIRKWEVADNYVLFEGEHSGYKRLKPPVVHERRIKYLKSSIWEVKDRVYLLNQVKDDFYHTLSYVLILAPGAKVIKSIEPDGFENLIISAGDIKVKVTFSVEGQAEFEVNVHSDSWYSPAYGVKIANSSLRWKGVFRGRELSLHLRLERIWR